jgi:hypothetical protein
MKSHLPAGRGLGLVTLDRGPARGTGSAGALADTCQLGSLGCARDAIDQVVGHVIRHAGRRERPVDATADVDSDVGDAVQVRSIG